MSFRSWLGSLKPTASVSRRRCPATPGKPRFRPLREVTWQQLGEGFESHQIRFQILHEGDYENKKWRDELTRLLEASLEA